MDSVPRDYEDKLSKCNVCFEIKIKMFSDYFFIPIRFGVEVERFLKADLYLVNRKFYKN